MTLDDVHRLVESQIGNGWGATNDHGVVLKRSIITPRQIRVIARNVRKGRVFDVVTEVWLLLREDASDGYSVVFDDKRNFFGLASRGFKEDKYPVVSEWYREFMAAFEGM